MLGTDFSIFKPSAHIGMTTQACRFSSAWWRHQMETFSVLLVICAGNSPVPGEFTAQRPVTRGFDVFSDLHPNKRLNKQWWGWWFETPSCPLWRHRNGVSFTTGYQFLESWIVRETYKGMAHRVVRYFRLKCFATFTSGGTAAIRDDLSISRF